MPHKQPRGPKGQFISKKSLTSLSDTSFANTSAESSPLDTPELRANEIEEHLPDQENPEHESQEVCQQLEQANEEDRESLAGAPDPEANTLPTFNDQPPKTLIAVVQSQSPIILWPVPPITPIKTFLKPITAKTTPQSLAKPLSKSKKMSGSSSAPGWFHSKADENAQNFLREVEHYIMLNELKMEQGKIMVFSTLLSAGSIADTWWNKLDSKQITVAGVPTWAHLQFHMNLQQLVNEAGVNTTAGLVYQVRENLPMVIKELTTPGLAEWVKFLDEIKALDTNKLREKAETAWRKKEEEKAQNTRLERLEIMQTDAVEIMRLQLQWANIGHAPTEQTITPSSNNIPRICYIAKESSSNPRQPAHQHQLLTQEE
ncbi:hypothetical protein BDR05DRAFT_994705 [Suillus weaverae]|nr:hypothetical protein BDR05DRAFT_994705 [Suillus weaverae]